MSINTDGLSVIERSRNIATPNFFIIGAPKCGTTALYEYLRNHPNLFLPWEKEPHFLADDFPAYRRIQTWRRYQQLFQGIQPEHAAVGEASVFYLFSRTAVPNIRRLYPRAKIIVMVRNPIDMVYSLHSQFVYSFREDEKDFLRAWALQEPRRRGENLPRHCPEPSHLQYAAVGRLGEQVARLLEQAPRDLVKVVIFDDFKADPARIYSEVLDFLGVPLDGRSNFPPVNENHVHRFEGVNRFLMTPPFPLNLIKRGIKDAFGLEKTRVASAIYDLNKVRRKRTPLDSRVQSMLAHEFREDIQQLETLLDRDLSGWYQLTDQGLRDTRL